MTPDQPDLPAILEWPHWTYKSHLNRRLLAAQVAWTLKLDGPIDATNAMVDLAERLESRGVDLSGVSRLVLSNLVATLAHQANATSKGSMTDIPIVRRTVCGRRTTHLSVLGSVLPPNPFADEPAKPATTVAAEPALPDLPPPPTPIRAVRPFTPPPEEAESVAGNGAAPSRTITVRSLEDKAMLVLRLAGEVALGIAALPPATPADNGERLTEAIAESERLRRRMQEETERRREAEEQLASQKRVNGALKAQADILQNNLDAHMRYERRPNESGRRVLDQMMREPASAR